MKTMEVGGLYDVVSVGLTKIVQEATTMNEAIEIAKLFRKVWKDTDANRVFIVDRLDRIQNGQCWERAFDETKWTRTK